MATVLTQSYLLLGEEPIEKISSKLQHNGASTIGNGTITANGTASNNNGTVKSSSNGSITANGTAALSNGKACSNGSVASHDRLSSDGLTTTEEEDSYVKVSKDEFEANEESTSSDQVKTEHPIIYKWDNIIAVTIVHLLAVYGVFYMAIHWSTLTILFSFLMGGMAGFGVTGGAHRLWTHRAYKANTPLQVILLFCYTVAGQNTIYEWVRDHRVHHKYSETDADPHNSNRGFFFSHVGWLLSRKHPQVIAKGNKIDMTDITSDPLLEWHRKNFIWLRILICFILPTWIPMYLWNETFAYAFFSNIVRFTMTLNATWSVNSFAHIWGYKPYDKRIQPVENIGVAIFSMGEGWHNYHHAFPWDYRASEMGYRYNYTAFLIDQFAKIGWAYDLKKPSESLVANMAAKYGEVPRRRDVDLQRQAESKKSS